MGTRPLTAVGVGLYTEADAARLLKAPAPKLRRWANGYFFAGPERPGFSPPVLVRRSSALRSQRLLTFLDLVELYFVARFRQRGVSMQLIRAAAQVAVRLFNTDHPFAVARFRTDGHRLLAELRVPSEGRRGGTDWLLELPNAQYVIEHFAGPFFESADLEGDTVARYWPLGKGDRVVIDPARSFGKPIDAETAVPTFAVYLASAGGASPEDIASWYGVPLVAVESALRYERWLDSPADKAA
jgi:uncharacterized protein (DUF433 family)